MSKVLISADLHIHPHRNDMRRVEDGLECLRWIYRTAEIAGCSRVIFAGDFLHSRFSLNAYAYSKACKIVASSPIRTIFLLGNHDMFYEDRWDVHSLTPIREWADVIENPQPKFLIDKHEIDLLPYTPHPSKHLPMFKTPASSGVLISHLSIADALLNPRFGTMSVEDDTKDKEVIRVEAFKQWRKVWLGHYHYGQRVSNNVEYIGSPLQLTFGEAGQVKHVAIFDLDTHETIYVVNDVSPRFHVIETVEQIDTVDLTNSYVQIRCTESINSKFELRKRMSKLGAREIEFSLVPVDIAAQTTKALSNIANIFSDKTQLIEKYIDTANIPSHLDITTLKKIGKEIVSRI